MPDLSPLRNVRTIEEGCISTEEKAKVVTAAWGTEFIQFLAAIAILHQDGMKKRMNWTIMILRKGRIAPGSLTKDEFILFSNRPGANS